MGKPDDKDVCLDSKLRVRGIGSLRVADLSICPKTVKSVLNPHFFSTIYILFLFFIFRRFSFSYFSL